MELFFHLIALIVCVVFVLLLYKRMKKAKKDLNTFYLRLIYGFTLFFMGRLLMLLWIGSFFVVGYSSWHSPWVLVAAVDFLAILVFFWSVPALKKS